MTRKTPSGAGNEHGTGKKALALLIGTICGNVGTNVSLAGPGGGVVTQGQGAISTPNSTSTVIDQASNRLSIDWQSFDVAANESVRFNQPTSSSVALNRILDQKASEVFGRIDANGRVVLFNSHGIMFGAGSQVNVGSLLATSLNVISFDESTGQLRLAAAGSPGSVINNGSITAAPGGSVSLVGGLVSNNGLIVADFGSVNLAAGRSATLDFYGGGLLRFEADSSLTDNPSGAAAGVSNSGTVSADGGQVLLTTSAAQNVFDRAVNNDGLVSAGRIENVGGTIRLVGAGGTVVSSGVLDASGVGAGSTGGTVHVLGENVGLFGNAVVDVSGDAGGGVALIGGDYQGAALDVPNARHTIVAEGASISADAGVAGDGGRVILWSEDSTRFYGSISARGGAQSGNGGLAEVSSHGGLAFGGSVRVGAPAGNGGTLLLDPDNITVNATGPDPANLDFTSLPGEDAVVGADDIVQALEDNALVFLRALDTIDINAAINVAGNDDAENSALELRAGGDVILDASITLNDGDLSIFASDAGGINDPAGTIDFSGGSLNVGTGNIILSAGGDITTTTETITGGSLNVSGALVNIDTNLGSLEAITTGALTVNDSGTLTVSSVSAPSANITANGNLTVVMISTTGATSLTSTNGAILDDGADTTIAANDLTLDAETDIGSITNLANGTGSALDIDVDDDLTVTVADEAGDINLRFFTQLPPGDVSIDLGGGGDATGRILLQTATGLAFDASALPTDSIDLGAANTAQVGLRAGGADLLTAAPADSLLTLSSNPTSLFVDNPTTFAVAGSNIRDTDALAAGDAITFNLANGTLIFDSGADSDDKVLTTTVATLNASVNGADLDVIETNGINVSASAVNVDVSTVNGSITVGTVTATGDASLVAVGAGSGITLGTVNANTTTGTVTLTANATGDIVDAVGTTPSVVANQLTITAGRSADLDTNVDDLTAAVGTGGLAIRDQNTGLDVNAVTSGGGLGISSTGGTMNVDGTVTANGTATLLATGGAIDMTGNAVIANGTGNISLTATGGTNGITLGTLTATGNTVTLSAAGDIVDAAGTTASVVADGLIITTAQSADLDTDVDDLTAAVGTGGLGIRDQNTGLDVNTVTSGGPIDIASAGGTMNVDGAVTAATGLVRLTAVGGAIDMTGNSVTANGTGNIELIANGATNGITLGTLTATGNTVTLSAAGDIVDAGGAASSVNANQLTITTAQSADLDTDVNALTATVTTGGLAIRDQNTGLNVNSVNSGAAATISTTGGTLNVDGAVTANGAVALTATGGAIDMTGQTVTANGVNNINLTATGGTNGITLGTLNAIGDTVILAAAGDIVDAAGATSSVNANQLTVTTARSADLDTDVTSLTATVGTGGIGIRDQNAGLTVTAITSGGPVGIETAGTLTVTGTVNAGTSSAALTATTGGSVLMTGGSVSANNGITVNAASDITLGTLTTNTATVAGTVSLTAGGAITDAAPSTPSVVGNTLTITAATSANLDTNVVNVNANNIATTLDIRDQVGALTANVAATGAVNISTTNGNLNVNGATGNGVTLSAGGAGSVLRAGAVNAGAGAANLSAAAGSIVDDDTINPGETTVITGATVNLTALNNIGTVDEFVDAEGSSVDVNTTGALNAWVTNTITDEDTDINLNLTGAPLIAADGIRLGDILTPNRTGEVLLQSPNALNLQNLTNGAINIGASNTASVGYISGATLTLPAAGSPTDTSPFNLLVSGDDVIVSGGSRTIGITANTAVFNSANPGGAYTLNTNVDTLHADVGNVGLTVNEFTGDIALGGIAASTVAVNINTAGGAILDDGDDLTEVAAGSVTLDSSGAIGAAGAGALDVNTANLTATTTTGDVFVNSLGASTVVDIVAGSGANNVTLAGTGAITDAPGATPSVVANQLNITSAGSVNLDTNVNTLNASGVTGALSIREQTGALEVTNAVGTDVSLSTTGLGNTLTLGSVTATGTVTLTADGSILDGAGPTPSVNANVLSVSTNSNVDLDTNVNSLNAVVTGGTANFREQSGALTVTSALGAAANFNISTASGNLNATMVSGQTVTLNAGGTGSDLVLGTVQAATTATLSANDAITDAAGATPSVQANQLNIAGAGSVDLDTNVNTVGTTGLVTSAFNIREQSGALTLASAAAGTVNVSTVAGNLNVTNASPTGNLALTAGGAGSVLSVTNASTDTNATLTSGGAITLGTVNASTGTVTMNAGGAITDAAGATPSVVANQLTIGSAASADLDTNVSTLTATGVTGALTVREQTGALTAVNAVATGAVNISTVAGALNNVSATGSSVTLAASTDLSLATVNSGAGTTTLTAGGAITDGAGATPSVVGGQLTIAGAGSANLDTNVDNLNASAITGALTVREQSGPVTVINASAAGDVNVSTVAGDLNVTDATSTGGVLTLTAGGTGNLTIAGTTATGASVDLTSGGNMTLGTANATAGDATLTSGGTITLGTVNATGGVTLDAAGAITDATGAAPSVVANTLSITGAASTDLDTNVNTLVASGVTGTLTVREQTGALALTNANAGTVNVSTVAGNLNVTTATGGAVSLSAGGAASNLTLGTVNATGTATLAAGGTITDAAGATPSVNAAALNISSAGSADLDTNVNTLTASTTGALTIREQTGALAVTNATSTGGLVNISTVGGALTATSVTGNGVTLNAGGASSALTLGTVNAGAGTATLTTGGAITDAAGATPSVVANALTITGAASADLDTNVNTLTATTSGALAIREQTGALTVANATSTTSTVNISNAAGAINVTNAAGTGVSLNAGGAGNGLTLGTVNAGTGTATLAAGGAITDGTAVSVTANQLTVTGAGSVDLDTNVNTLNATGVTGALSVREGTGALTVANATSTGGLVTLATAAGALTVTNASGSGVTLTAGGAGNGITLGTVSAGTGTATLTAPGAITDGTTGTALTAGNAVMTAGSIGSATNTLETSLNTVTATSSSGGMFIREANDITLTNLSAITANNQDIYVGTTGDVTVSQVSNANGRVLLAAGGDILSTGSGTHITAGNAELRAGLDTSGGRIGTVSQPLRMSVPASVPGGAGGTGAPVPSVLLLQNESAPNSVEPAQSNQINIVSGTINISTATFDPAPASTPTNAFLTTTFTTRTAAGDGVNVENAQFNVNGSLNTTGQVGLSTQGAATVLAAQGATNAQGEGTLYIDWASFDPDVSLFGTVNPPICLPRDQAEEDDGSAESTGGCATTTAQYDGSFRMPEVKLVITSRGVEWITVKTGQISVFPLIGQLK